MYFVGIDISKFKHDCAVIDEIGDTIQPSWSFRNDREGFSLLKERLDSLPGEKKIGLEATGHYGQNLKLFLEANGFAFMEFNPLLVSRFVHGKSLRNTKTDPIDAGNVAQYLMTVEYKPYPPSFYHLDQLKSLTRFRSSLVRQPSRQLVELTNALDKMFPEFKPFFKGKFSATALYILDHYQSPERVASMNTRSYEPLRKISRGHFSLNDFVKLKALAKNTVGCTTGFLLQEMSILLELYTQLDAKVEELDDQIEECVGSVQTKAIMLYLSFQTDSSAFVAPGQSLPPAVRAVEEIGGRRFSGRLKWRLTLISRKAPKNTAVAKVSMTLLSKERNFCI